MRTITTEIPVTAETLAKFERRVDRSGECHRWLGPVTGSGYGMFHATVDGVNMRERAHRFALRAAGNHVTGSDSCHSCDTPACVRVEHLRFDSHAVNMSEMSARGRANPYRRGGARNPAAKLTPQAVAAIRGAGGPAAPLAARYGVSTTAIYRARKGLTWSD